MSTWSDKEKEIFYQHAGKIPDKELAVLVGRSFKTVKDYRHSHDIPMEKKPKYTEEMLQYIRENYRMMSNREMAENLMNQYPHLTFTKHGIKSTMTDIGCKRTKEDIEKIKERCIERGVFIAAAAKARFKLTKHKPGVVFYHFYGNSDKLRHCIKVEDPDHPGEYKIILYEKYVWQQHHPYDRRNGVITLKDPNKPITIENLYLKKYDGLNLKIAAQTLPDWFVANTITRYDTKEIKDFFLNNPELLEPKRLILQIKLELKAIKNAGKSENNTVEGTPAKNDQ